MQEILATINQTAIDIVQASGLSSLQFFMAGFALGMTVILVDAFFDFKTRDVSISLPANRQIGIASMIVLFSAVTSIIADSGVETLIMSFRADIVMAFVISVGAALLYNRRR